MFKDCPRSDTKLDKSIPVNSTEINFFMLKTSLMIWIPYKYALYIKTALQILQEFAEIKFSELVNKEYSSVKSRF